MPQNPPEPTVVNGKVFDRVPRWSESNDRYTVASHLEVPTQPAQKLRARHTWLDQGTEGGCTGYGSATALSFAPHTDSHIVAANAEYMYLQAKIYDEYPGINYTGSSVLGAMQGLKANGYILDYWWAKTVDEIINAISHKSSVVCGINWYQNMFDVSADGLIRIGGTVAGGHCITASSQKNSGELIRFDNTWGKSWGESGSAWITAEDLGRLLNEQGEFACFTKANPLPVLGTSGRVDPENGNPGVTGS